MAQSKPASPSPRNPADDDLAQRLARGAEPPARKPGATAPMAPMQPPPSGKPKEGPGEFTQMFAPISVPPPAPPSPFASPSPPVASNYPPSAPPPSAGGSEFTRMMQRAEVPMPPMAGMASPLQSYPPPAPPTPLPQYRAPQVPPPPDPVAAVKAKLGVVVGVIVGLFVLMIGLVLFLVLRKH
ncbi:MAG TPA: hypothetical protein VJN95_01985 [Gemmatimonadales bacterium]|nr:hypothetical protein [Gemmatimonadales bacterium]